MESPKDYGLPHAQWRLGQKAMIDAVFGAKTKYIMVIAPTGAGKTTLPAALSHRGNTIAIVETKQLQWSNYAPLGAKVLQGRGNYPCAHPAKHGMDASNCIFPGFMQRCPFAEDCAYKLARDAALEATFASLNYAYYTRSSDKFPTPEYLVLDEAHDLSDIVLDHVGVYLRMQDIIDYGIPMFPRIENWDTGNGLVRPAGPTPVERALDYLRTVEKDLRATIARLENYVADADNAKRRYNAELLHKNVQSSLAAMELSRQDWYVRSGMGIMQQGEMAFFARPLTARHHFAELFGDADHVVLMSATLEPATFATELGIDPKDLTVVKVPPIWAPVQRPVYELDVPSLGQKSADSDWEKQAQMIARALEDCPSDWSGLIHTTSKYRASDLRYRLGRYTKRPLLVPDFTKSTEHQDREWVHFRGRHGGAILIVPNKHQGYDGTEERINISAKTPFPDTSGGYEQARQRYNGRFYFARTAVVLEQMMGRVRRGNATDYDAVDAAGNVVERRAYCAMADRNWRKVRNYLSQDYLDCVITI